MALAEKRHETYIPWTQVVIFCRRKIKCELTLFLTLSGTATFSESVDTFNLIQESWRNILKTSFKEKQSWLCLADLIKSSCFWANNMDVLTHFKCFKQYSCFRWSVNFSCQLRRVYNNTEIWMQHHNKQYKRVALLSSLS